MQGTETIERELPGIGDSDYPYALTFSSAKFTAIAFGYDREHCEDVLANILQGNYRFAEGDKDFEKIP